MATSGSKSREVIQKKSAGKKKTKSIVTEEKSKNKKADEDPEKLNKQKWAKRMHGMSCRDMSKEFNAKIKKFVATDVTFDVCKAASNEVKNRYADVLCIDKTRVPLKGRGKDDDYIHANWLFAPGGTKYICTQAPLPDTCEDFWHMTFTEKASIILMLCNYTEGSDMEKCCHYFPEKPKEKKTFGAYTITMKEKLDEIELEDTDFSMMEIKHKGGDTRLVKHCFMRYWIDNCAPVETEPILKLWRWVRKYHNNDPVVVHCSAGVGRTSTFVGIEVATLRIATNPDINFMEVVKELRKQRYQSIQSHVQFLYLHYLVLDNLVYDKIVEPYAIKDSKFVEEYRRHTEKRTKRAKKDCANQKNQKIDEDPNSKKPQESDADA